MPYKNYNIFMNLYMKERWEKRKRNALDFLGGKCVRCEATEMLDFDHIEPSSKIMTIARASSRSESFFWNEVKKCQLLCVPCHLIKSAEDIRSGKVTIKRKSMPL